MRPAARTSPERVAGALLLVATLPAATLGVTQCGDFHTCSDCSQHTFGCSKPDSWTGAWPWGSIAIDPSVGKMNNETECYFSCGWCPNTLNHETGEPGVCVQVTHTVHGNSCDGSLNCAECTCQGEELNQLKAGDCTCTCPGTGLWQEQPDGTVMNGEVAGEYVLGTEEVLLAPAGPTGVVKAPKYWQQRGNPSCPDYHDHVTFCRYCSKDRPNPDTGRILYNDTGEFAQCEGVELKVNPATGVVNTLEEARIACPLQNYGDGGGWRAEVNEIYDGYDALRDPMPKYTNVKCGWCHNPPAGRPHCQVVTAFGAEFEQMGGALEHCPCIDETGEKDPETGLWANIPELAMPLALRYGGIPEGSWCRRCPVGTWAQRDECHKALGNGPPLRTVEKTPFTEELETYQYVVPINVGDAMSGGDPMGDVAFDVTEYIYHSTAVTIYICIVVFLLFVVIGIGAIMIFKKKADKKVMAILQDHMDSQLDQKYREDDDEAVDSSKKLKKSSKSSKSSKSDKPDKTIKSDPDKYRP